VTGLPGSDDLWFLPLGGTGEIGMNLNLYGHDGAWLMVDLGVTFADERQPGIDLILPDPAFIEERRDNLAGLVLTHAHEDHIGAVPHIWPRLKCPMYATPFTAAALRRKLAEVGIDGAAVITEVPMSGRFSVGAFEIELITLTHSIPEPNAVVIRTAAGTVLHTGDWKLDPDPLVGDDYDEAALKALAEDGVLAMVCDSTNALVPGESGSEGTVRENLSALIGGVTGRLAVACFATNVARLETVMKLAERHGRRVALVGRSMHRIYEAACETRRGSSALHRQPGRAARGLVAHRPGRSPRRRAGGGRCRGVFFPGHTRQRAGDLCSPERTGAPGRQGDDRPGASDPRVRSSRPGRAGPDVPLGAAADRHSGAW
jgi:ribonuclease J